MRVADKDAATDSSGLALEVHVCLAFDLGYGVLVVDMCAELGRERPHLLSTSSRVLFKPTCKHTNEVKM